MEPDLIDSPALRGGADAAGIGLLTSLALPEGADPAVEDPEERRHAPDLLLRGVDLTADMGATVFTGVLYSAIGKRIDRRPCDDDYARAAEVLRDVARHAAAASRSGSSQSTATRPTSLTQPPKRTAYAASWVSRTSAFTSTRYQMNIDEDDLYAATLAAVPHLVHVHPSESHRGIPGHGTVDWNAIFRGLADGGDDGVVGLESFVQIAEAMRAATYIWRPLAPDSDALVREGLAFLRGIASANGLGG
jgi:D-psicose/D-tagatose/L-ribulose 3-epimerase